MGIVDLYIELQSPRYPCGRVTTQPPFLRPFLNGKWQAAETSAAVQGTITDPKGPAHSHRTVSGSVQLHPLSFATYQSLYYIIHCNESRPFQCWSLQIAFHHTSTVRQWFQNALHHTINIAPLVSSMLAKSKHTARDKKKSGSISSDTI